MGINIMNDRNKSDECSEFGDKIKEIRNLYGMTRNELSTALNIPPTTIRGIEQGNHAPSFAFIESIATHPIFRQYLLWILCKPWSEEDDYPEFPLDIKQIKPDHTKQERINQLEKQLAELKSELEAAKK